MDAPLCDKYSFSPGDMVIDIATGDRGILISKHRMLSDIYHPSPLFVWRILWFSAARSTSVVESRFRNEHPEHTMMIAIEEGQFSYYQCPKRTTAL
jgi:hypothetical protein